MRPCFFLVILVIIYTEFTAFFTDLLGFQPQLEITESQDQIDINLSLDPQDSGMFIGYRGEVLTAIQLILSLINQQQTDSWKPVRMNVAMVDAGPTEITREIQQDVQEGQVVIYAGSR